MFCNLNFIHENGEKIVHLKSQMEQLERLQSEWRQLIESAYQGTSAAAIIEKNAAELRQRLETIDSDISIGIKIVRSAIRQQNLRYDDCEYIITDDTKRVGNQPTRQRESPTSDSEEAVAEAADTRQWQKHCPKNSAGSNTHQLPGRAPTDNPAFVILEDSSSVRHAFVTIAKPRKPVMQAFRRGDKASQELPLEQPTNSPGFSGKYLSTGSFKVTYAVPKISLKIVHKDQYVMRKRVAFGLTPIECPF
jgi:hypothetical protein